MNWDSLSAFLDMGGYGFFVWGSYGVTALVLLLEVVFVVRRARTPTSIGGHRMRAESGTER